MRSMTEWLQSSADLPRSRRAASGCRSSWYLTCWCCGSCCRHWRPLCRCTFTTNTGFWIVLSITGHSFIYIIFAGSRGHSKQSWRNHSF